MCFAGLLRLRAVVTRAPSSELRCTVAAPIAHALPDAEYPTRKVARGDAKRGVLTGIASRSRRSLSHPFSAAAEPDPCHRSERLHPRVTSDTAVLGWPRFDPERMSSSTAFPYTGAVARVLPRKYRFLSLG